MSSAEETLRNVGHLPALLQKKPMAREGSMLDRGMRRKLLQWYEDGSPASFAACTTIASPPKHITSRTIAGGRS